MYTQFDDILTRLNTGKLWDFPGGVKPEGKKDLSNGEQLVSLPLPKTLYVTIKQHIGVEGHVEVVEGQTVLKGQPLTKSMNPFSVPVHAPTSGTIKKIAPHVAAHPSGLSKLTIEIEPDGADKWVELTPLPNFTELPKIKTVEAICNAGVSGMGGAGFPTHIKASPKKDVEFLVINGVECEPYISSDDRLMREHAWQIRQGIDVLDHLLNPKKVIIAIEDNKPEAIKAMQVTCQEQDKYIVCPIPTKYPAGGEKQLIQVLTNREVPKQGLPIDVGVIMQNVGTCYAVADAVFSGKPLIQRVVTLTGEALNRPQNAWVLMGTPMKHLLEQAEYQQKRQKESKVIMGGPMMGFTVASELVPVIKTTNCILVPANNELPEIGDEQPCIRCSACADACPASLLPQQLFWHSKAKELDKAQDYNLFDCIECGACAYVCPSEIPLVHYYRIAKAEIRNQEDEKDLADKARERFEARKARLVREQQEREEKHRKAAEARKQAMNKDGGSSKDKIAAALARAKAKKVATTDDLETTQKQDNVAAAIARAKAKREANKATAATPMEPAPSPNNIDKKDKVAAAIARAKAKREAANTVATKSAETTSSSDTTDKKDKVAAAVARAKAKRDAAKGTPKVNTATTDNDTQNQQTEKQSKAPAAATNGKDKRTVESSKIPEEKQGEVQKGAANAEQDSQPEPLSKQDKIAQAIAKAKAKREAAKQAQQEKQEEEK